MLNTPTVSHERRQHIALLVICNSILNDDRVRRVAPLSVELLEAQLAAVREGMRDDLI